MSATEIIDSLDRATAALNLAAKAAIELARSQAKDAAARLGDTDDWTRMPSKGERCRYSEWSRSKLNHLIDAGQVRKKRTAGCAYYSGADVRNLLNGPEA